VYGGDRGDIGLTVCMEEKGDIGLTVCMEEIGVI
jgi:hypothetical protein